MNPRSPLTPGGAFASVKDILSAKVCAQFLGVSEWTIYDRCDAPAFKNLNLSADEMLSLDAMCKEKAGKTPLLDYYRQRMDAEGPTAAESLQNAGIELARDVGEIEGEILSVGTGLSNNKIIDMEGGLHKAKRCLSGIEDILEKARKA